MTVVENSKPEKWLNRMMGGCCFILGGIFAAPAIWLCIRGGFPDVPIDGATFIPIDGISVNGIPVGKWFFPLIVAGLGLIATVLWFAGWRVGRVRKTEAA